MAADLTAHFIANTHILINDPAMAELMTKASMQGEFDSLEMKDKSKLFYWSMASLKSGDFAHYQWLSGNLDDDLWVGTAQTLVASFRNPNHPWTKTWETNKQFCSPQFQSYIESIRNAEVLNEPG